MNNPKQNRQTQPYPLNFEILPPTPNHNPLIQATPQDTCHDVTAVMEFIGLFFLQSREAAIADKAYLQLDDKTYWGLTCTMNCLINALNYEIYHRPPSE